MDAKIVVSWNLHVTPEEFRLIQKALRGALSDEERSAALALQEQLMRVRAKQAEQLAAEAVKAVTNIERKQGAGQ